MIDWHEVADERLLRHFREERMDADMIGARYGVCEEVVIARLKALGADVGRRKGHAHNLHALSDEQFRARVCEVGAAALAKRLGVDRQTVQRRQTRLGIVLPKGRRCSDGRFRGGEAMSDG